MTEGSLDDVICNRPLVIGHRGAAGHEVENTIEAFLRGIELGADGVECDVQVTKDGEPVIFHDESLLRLAALPGRLRRMTLAEMRATVKLTGGGTIPTLEELCKIPELSPAWLFVEIKERGIEEKVLDLVLRNRLSSNTVLGSFHRDTVRKLSEAGCPKVLQLAETYEELSGTTFTYAGLQYEEVTARRVEKLHARGLKVWAWTVNDFDDIRRILACKVDGIVSDYPDRVVAEIKRHDA